MLRQEEDYPLVEVPLSKLRYRWVHPTQQHQSSVLSQYLSWESVLKEDLHRLVSERDPLGMLYISIKERGLINPLIVKEDQGLYYVVVGNQRLAVLHAISYHMKVPWEESKTPIPCRVAKPEDSWFDNTEARKVCPYTPMVFDPHEKVWKKKEE